MTNDSLISGSKRTLSIGGATFDLFIRTDGGAIEEHNGHKHFSLPLGGKISISDVTGACGGGADNTAVALSRLGCNAAFSGVIGEDQWGEAILKNMKKEGVNTSHISIIEHEASSFSVILMSDTGERTILTHKGMDRHFHDVTFDREAMDGVQVVFLNRLHQDTHQIEDNILEALNASPDIHFSWNPGGSQVDAGLKSYKKMVARTNLLLLNKEEALAFAHTKTSREALHILSSAGAKMVCITDGEKGAIATDGKTLYKCPAIPCPVADMTGAGDAFGSAMTWALINGKNLPIALKAGTINAMSVVGEVGAQTGLLTEVEIQKKLTATDLMVSEEPL